jgi:hypothetical protein
VVHNQKQIIDMPDGRRGDRFGTVARVLFSLSAILALVTIAGFTYYSVIAPTPLRGAQGPLGRNSPDHDPPPLMMRPDKSE